MIKKQREKELFREPAFSGTEKLYKNENLHKNSKVQARSNADRLAEALRNKQT
jgi:hypothetical protein